MRHWSLLLAASVVGTDCGAEVLMSCENRRLEDGVFERCTINRPDCILVQENGLLSLSEAWTESEKKAPTSPALILAVACVGVLFGLLTLVLWWLWPRKRTLDHQRLFSSDLHLGLPALPGDSRGTTPDYHQRLSKGIRQSGGAVAYGPYPGPSRSKSAGALRKYPRSILKKSAKKSLKAPVANQESVPLRENSASSQKQGNPLRGRDGMLSVGDQAGHLRPPSQSESLRDRAFSGFSMSFAPSVRTDKSNWSTVSSVKVLGNKFEADNPFD